jgi:PAS domain S-box-containing protein
MTATAAAPAARADPAEAGGLESFLDTLPVKLYPTRLAPPYDTEFLTGEAGTVVGYPADDFVGHDPKRRWHELIDPADRERVADTWLGAPADGSVIEVEYRVRRADGTYAWILSRARKLQGPDGAPYLHGAAIDVTARHEAAELQRRLDAESARRAEIEASRARIIEAADAARRRLERDLHDGAQQQLVIASLTLGRAASRARGTPAEPLVQEAAGRVRDALAELRELARGIHPATLTERGLKPALEALAARSPVPVALTAPPQRFAPGIEAALYFTVAEALTNVAKYARATRATVRVEQRDHAVVAEIADDGIGGADPRAGSGLRGLADRLAAASGTLETHSPRCGGTRVRAHVPLHA